MTVETFSNGDFDATGKHRVTAAVAILNEDWKTAMALSQRSVAAGETGVMFDIIDNFYGRWARVEFDDAGFSLYCETRKLILGDPV